MKKIVPQLFLPLLLSLFTVGFFSCKGEFSEDEPLPPSYKASVYSGTNNKTVFSIDEQSGKINWKAPVDGEVHATPVFFKDAVWVGTMAGTLYKLDKHTGEVLATVKVGGAIEGTPLPYEGHLLVPGGSKLLYINVDDLSTMWSYTGSGPVSSPTAHAIPSIEDLVGSAIFISSGSKVTALNAEGGMIWEFNPTGAQRFQSSPCTVNDHYLYVGNDNGSIYSVHLNDGTLNWRYATEGSVKSSPIQIGGNVLVGSNDRYLYSIDSASGNLRWKAAASDQIVSSPAVDNQYVYFGSYDGYIYCVDIINGGLKWKKPSFGLINASPTVSHGFVYIGSYDKNLYKLDTADGAQHWVRNLNGQLQSSAIVHYLNGVAVPSISGDYKY